MSLVFTLKRYGRSTMVVLIASDSKTICVDDEVVMCSSVLRRKMQERESDDPIYVKQVVSTVLEKVLEYCNHYKDASAVPAEVERRRKEQRPYSTELGEWDSAFIDVEQTTLFDIILAAYYLDIRPLLDLGSMRVANMVNGKTVQEIRELFDIVNDFTPQEEEQLRRENEWVE